MKKNEREKERERERETVSELTHFKNIIRNK